MSNKTNGYTGDIGSLFAVFVYSPFWNVPVVAGGLVLAHNLHVLCFLNVRVKIFLWLFYVKTDWQTLRQPIVLRKTFFLNHI